MRTFYPPIEPYNADRLQVSSIHNLYYEECGNPTGIPIVFLHGGPGGGTTPDHRRYFDPAAYRIVVFDQRGAGKSTPHASLEENTTWDLVADIEKLRLHLGIEKWHVFGGSWGSTLAICYAESHPDRVSALILRGIYLGRQKENKWLYQGGASAIYPDKWEDYLAPIPEEERGDLISAYYKRLCSDDEAVCLAAAKAWSTWEASILKLIPDQSIIEEFGSPHLSLAIARIECHYFVNDVFLETQEQLIENIAKIRHIPARIVHGRYDVVCSMENAWDLHKAWPEAELKIIPDAGHSASEPGIIDALVEATDKFRNL
jgi:proline iminopeptidase